MLAKRFAYFARDLLCALEDGVEGSKFLNPLGRGLWANSWNPFEIIAGLPHQGRELGVLNCVDTVLLQNRSIIHLLQVEYTLYRVENFGLFGNQLEGVPVS